MSGWNPPKLSRTEAPSAPEWHHQNYAPTKAQFSGPSNSDPDGPAYRDRPAAARCFR